MWVGVSVNLVKLLVKMATIQRQVDVCSYEIRIFRVHTKALRVWGRGTAFRSRELAQPGQWRSRSLSGPDDRGVRVRTHLFCGIWSCCWAPGGSGWRERQASLAQNAANHSQRADGLDLCHGRRRTRAWGSVATGTQAQES